MVTSNDDNKNYPTDRCKTRRKSSMAKHHKCVIWRITTICCWSFMVLSASHALFHLIFQQIWFCHHLYLVRKLRFQVVKLHLHHVIVIIIVTLLEEKEMRTSVGLPSLREWVGACQLVEGQCGAMGSAGLGLRRKGRVVAPTGLAVIWGQLSSCGVVTAGILPTPLFGAEGCVPIHCESARRCGPNCCPGRATLLWCPQVPAVSHLWGSGILSALCSVHPLAPGGAELLEGRHWLSWLCHLARAWRTTGVQRLLTTGVSNGSSAAACRNPSTASSWASARRLWEAHAAPPSIVCCHPLVHTLCHSALITTLVLVIPGGQIFGSTKLISVTRLPPGPPAGSVDEWDNLCGPQSPSKVGWWSCVFVACRRSVVRGSSVQCPGRPRDLLCLLTRTLWLPRASAPSAPHLRMTTPWTAGPTALGPLPGPVSSQASQVRPGPPRALL